MLDENGNVVEINKNKINNKIDEFAMGAAINGMAAHGDRKSVV